MDVEGGGWLAVFNYMDPGSSSYSDAADFHAAIIVNDDLLDPVQPDETSTAIATLVARAVQGRCFSAETPVSFTSRAPRNS